MPCRSRRSAFACCCCAATKMLAAPRWRASPPTAPLRSVSTPRAACRFPPNRRANPRAKADESVAMKHPLFAKALVLCAALSLPVLAAAPAAGPAAAAAKSARVIVKFKADGPLMRQSALSARAGELPRVQHASRLAQRFGMAMRDGHAVAPRTQVVFAQGVSSAELVAKLQADPDVEYAEVDARVFRAEVPNDPRYPGSQTTITPAVGQWYLRPPDSTLVSAINAQVAWDLNKGSPAIVVAVIDTGVRGDHPDLVGKLLPGYDFVSEDGPNNFASA